MSKNALLVIGIVIIISGLLGTSLSFFGGFLLVISGLLLIPQTTFIISKSLKVETRVLIAIFFLFLGGYMIFDNNADLEAVKKEAAIFNALPQSEKDSINFAKSRIDSIDKINAKIERHFSLYDGQHKELEKMVIAAMNDEDSYEHIKTVREIKGDNRMLIQMTYSGKNAFGGTVKNMVTAEVDFDGNILKIIK
jgi:hypothetical protein